MDVEKQEKNGEEVEAEKKCGSKEVSDEIDKHRRSSKNGGQGNDAKNDTKDDVKVKGLPHHQVPQTGDFDTTQLELL